MSTYGVEFAKSGRSKCKKCKLQIEKGVLRIQVETEGDDYNTTINYHPMCFNLPKKVDANTVEEFVSDILQDKSESGHDILPAKADELITAIQSKTPKKKIDDDPNNPMTVIKRTYQARLEEQDNEEEPPPSKKAKTNDAAKVSIIDEKMVDYYEQYHKNKIDQLKDILRWNRQVMTGTKDILLYKVLDGCTHGRLGHCPLCGGRLKIDIENLGGKILCAGTFDEDMHVRINCSYTCPTPIDAPRYQPWFTEEPSEEEKEEMDRLEEGGGGGGAAAAGTTANDDVVAQLQEAASKLDWTLTSRDGLRQAAKDMVGLLQSNDKKLDMPEDAKTAMQKVGQILAGNKDCSASDVIPLMIKEFGFVEDKKVKAEAKTESHARACKNPQNASLVSAFDELSELYFKQGNSNAGITYKKVIAAVADLDFEVTADNAKGLGKGKTKVQNIGKSSADKIYEFVTTGTMEKLEEKRAEAS